MSLTSAQLANAQIIAEVGVSIGVPMTGETIATALQESDLQNLDYGDRDSLGQFQQRPPQGGGTSTEIINPSYAARQFYTQLLQDPGWRSMSTKAAAEAVQRSAFPEAYEKWSQEAATLAAQFTGNLVGSPAAMTDSQTRCRLDVGSGRVLRIHVYRMLGKVGGRIFSVLGRPQEPGEFAAAQRLLP